MLAQAALPEKNKFPEYAAGNRQHRLAHCVGSLATRRANLKNEQRMKHLVAFSHIHRQSLGFSALMLTDALIMLIMLNIPGVLLGVRACFPMVLLRKSEHVLVFADWWNNYFLVSFDTTVVGSPLSVASQSNRVGMRSKAR